MYFSKLYYDVVTVGVPAFLGAYVFDGLQVAATDDGGTSWGINTYVSLRDFHVEATNADRPWLGFGPSGEVYLSINHFHPIALAQTTPGPWGIYVARSDDCGASFGPFTLVKTHYERGGGLGGVAGGVVVDSEGTVFLPMGDRTTNGGPNGLVLATSKDRGATFELIPVGPPGPAAPEADWLPRAATSGTQLAVAWRNDDGHALIASSNDSGTTWTNPIVLSTKAPVAPWIEAGRGGFDVTWHEGEGQSFDVFMARVTNHTWSGSAPLAPVWIGSGTGPHGNTDFSNLAHHPDGRAMAVWADDSTGRTYVAIEP